MSKKVVFKRGNIAGLAKHLAKKYGGDPGFHTKCMGADELQGYSQDARAAICAKAHKLAVGIWPGEHGGANPNGPERKCCRKVVVTKAKKRVVVYNNTEENDDWMKSLPGYKNEVKIHEELARKHGKKGPFPGKLQHEQ